jgi:hypothetical protein
MHNEPRDNASFMLGWAILALLVGGPVMLFVMMGGW